MKRKVIVGLDPGVAAWGMCAVDVETREVLCVYQFKSTKSMVFPRKQYESFLGLCEDYADICRRFDIVAIAIEALPIGRGVVSVHQSIGLFLSIVFGTAVPLTRCVTYTASEWKKAVTGKGNRTKKECRPYIKELAGWDPNSRTSDDAYDSVGVALCHILKEGYCEV